MRTRTRLVPRCPVCKQLVRKTIVPFYGNGSGEDFGEHFFEGNRCTGTGRNVDMFYYVELDSDTQPSYAPETLEPKEEGECTIGRS